MIVGLVVFAKPGSSDHVPSALTFSPDIYGGTSEVLNISAHEAAGTHEYPLRGGGSTLSSNFVKELKADSQTVINVQTELSGAKGRSGLN